MSKRVADKELTDRNWEDEEEPEEAGIFAKAPEEVIKQRVIKTAKRRVANANGDSKPSLFAGFSGFGATQKLNVQPSVNFPKIGETNGDTKPLFSFGSKSDNSTAGKTPGETKPLFSFGSKTEVVCSSPGNGGTSSISGTSSTDSISGNPQAIVSPFAKTDSDSKEGNSEVFLRKLKKLNKSVIKFASEHVEKNAFVILTSVFNDYEKHLKRLQSEQTFVDTSPHFKLSKTPQEDKVKTEEEPQSSSQEPENTSTKAFSFGAAPSAPAFSFGAAPSAPAFSFGAAPSAPAFSFGAAPSAPAFSFGAATKAPAVSSEGSFSFKPTTSAADSTQSSTGFSFKPTSAGTSLFGKPMGSSSFSGFGGLVGKPADSTENTVEEEVTPPVPEKVEHIDKEALYHIKCKLFLKAGDSWNEKGLGIANLIECSGKVQLLIRNDTIMGTVILNTLLHGSMPINKSGKNGILLVATNEDSKTETYLCRVNKEKVDEFLEKLKEYKQGAPSSTQ